MKKAFCLFAVLLVLLCGCAHDAPPDQLNTEGPSEEPVFTRTENGNLVSPEGVEYAYLDEGLLWCFGDREFLCSVEGEEKTSEGWGISYQTGMFSIEDDESHDILIRQPPHSEWQYFYRKASLPPADFSVDACSRLELVLGTGAPDPKHTTCGDGISDKAEIAAFLSDVRAQKDPQEAGLHDLITTPDGMQEHCYTYAVIYGFFEDEPNLAIRMYVTSHNDLAYSVSIDGEEYVLPEEWLPKLQAS